NVAGFECDVDRGGDGGVPLHFFKQRFFETGGLDADPILNRVEQRGRKSPPARCRQAELFIGAAVRADNARIGNHSSSPVEDGAAQSTLVGLTVDSQGTQENDGYRLNPWHRDARGDCCAKSTTCRIALK